MNNKNCEVKVQYLFCLYSDLDYLKLIFLWSLSMPLNTQRSWAHEWKTHGESTGEQKNKQNSKTRINSIGLIIKSTKKYLS